MEKFGERESVLLGSFHSSPKSPHNHSGVLEMDFNDVFGGPPRRFSNQEVSMRYSFSTETVESEEGGGSSLLPGGNYRWSGFDEKPVFGEVEEDMYRRQLSGNDFYDDIFRGDNNSKSYHSPTSTSFDLLASSNPGSRVLSPSQKDISSSFPAQLSLAAKLTKAIDYPAFGSANRIKLKSKEGVDSPNASSNVVSLSRFSSQSKDFLDDVRSEVSHKSEESSSSSSFMAESSGGQKRNEVAKDSSESYETLKNSNQFHFSIYRWAGNGVPMLMPLIGSRKWRSSTGRRKKKMEKCSTSSNERMNKESLDMKMEKFEEYIVSVDSESDPLKVNIEEPEESSNVVKTKSHDVLSDQNPQILKPESIQTARNTAEPKIELDSKGKIGIQTNRDKESFLKPHAAKALGDLLGEGIAMEEGITTPRANMANRTADIRSRQNNSNVNDISSKKTAKNKGDASIKHRAEGKVREFVKIFNQETTSSPNKTKVTSSDPQSHSSRWKGIDIKGKENKTRKVADVEVNTHPDKQTMTDMPSKDGDNFNGVKVEQEVHSKSSNKKTDGLFADKKNDSNFSDPSPEAKVENNEDFFEGHFQVEELSNIEDKDSHSSGDSADIKTLDAKIHQWSTGRKGNIRSLLSTLHYVLWADSGWKPIALVDIIEGNAVNRAYKKAMLYLHPDKLQQKGAASHQKYTAEKVFEILQEAWDHFNALGAI